MVPFPWSRGLYLWGAPIWVPREADEQAVAAACQELESVLNRLTNLAEGTSEPWIGDCSRSVHE